MAKSFGRTEHRLIRSWASILFLVVVSISMVKTENISDLSLDDLQALVDQLVSPVPEYQLHAMSLRNQLLRRLQNNLRGPLQYTPEINLTDDDLMEIMDQQLAANPKRSLATLAKNGQLPTQPPENTEDDAEWTEKRNLGSLARSGDAIRGGKRNIGTLARDYQLPNGKRTVPLEARLRYMSMSPFSFSRNSMQLNKFPSRPPTFSFKRNLGALRGSLVHGNQYQKRSQENQFQNEYANFNDWYPNYSFIDPASSFDVSSSENNKEKRFLGRIMPPTRAKSTTNRGRK